jgi:hypothetical protein
MKTQTCPNCNGTPSTTRRPARGRLARVAIAVAIVVTIVYAELWTIRQGPTLVIDYAPIGASATTSNADIAPTSLPIAVLH